MHNRSGDLMRNLLLTMAAMLSLLGSWPASAADLPPIIYKGPKKAISFPGCGGYIGLHTFAENDKVQVAGTVPVAGGGVLSGIGGTYDVGAAIGGTAGYSCAKSDTSWWAIEVMASYKNTGTTLATPVTAGAATGVTASIDSRWSSTQRAKWGADWQTVLNYFPTLGSLFPGVPSLPVGATNTHVYIFGAIHEDQIDASITGSSRNGWRVRPGFGIGTMFQPGTSGGLAATPGTSKLWMDIWAEYIPAGKGVDLGVTPLVSVNSGHETRLGMAVIW